MLEPDLPANREEWEWLQQSDPRFLPLIQAFAPWIRDFPFFFSHGELCFTHCPAYPFSRHGLPDVRCQDDGFSIDGRTFASAHEAARHLEECLLDHHPLIFAGNLDHQAYARLRSLLDPAIDGGCPLGESPWFARAARQCRVAWADPEVRVEFWEQDELRETGCYSCQEAASKVESWLSPQ